jgi:DRG Family Regulatory Proteins, Tma46
LKWKTERLERKQNILNQAQKAKQDALSKLKSGFKNTGMVFSGRDMFEFNTDWAGMDDDDEGFDIDELNVMQVASSVEDLDMQKAD